MPVGNGCISAVTSFKAIEIKSPSVSVSLGGLTLPPKLAGDLCSFLDIKCFSLGMIPGGDCIAKFPGVEQALGAANQMKSAACNALGKLMSLAPVTVPSKSFSLLKERQF